jgi:hypothetical protein
MKITIINNMSPSSFPLSLSLFPFRHAFDGWGSFNQFENECVFCSNDLELDVGPNAKKKTVQQRREAKKK